MTSLSPRIALITDIHANLAALRAVLDAIAQERVGTYLCMGDLVGYGPSPHEVVAELRTLPVTCINGNHDRYTIGEIAAEVRPATREAIEYTRRVLAPEDMEFLRSLPDRLLVDTRVLLVHGSPRERDEYILSSEVAIASYKLFRADYGGVFHGFFGHTHIPMLIGDGKVVRQIDPNSTVGLKFRMPYLINPGSVGQPRDGNPDAAFGILDTEAHTFTFRRVPYDIDDTCKRIVEAGLQPHLGDRLRVGK